MMARSPSGRSAPRHSQHLPPRPINCSGMWAQAPGSVGIEWMRTVRGCEAIAIEPDAERRAMIAHNADQLGTPRLKIIPQAAPAAYEALPAPHAVFIGGGISGARHV